MADVEWGYRSADGKVVRCMSETFARRLANMRTSDGKPVRPGAVVVSRQVTEWAEVES